MNKIILAMLVLIAAVCAAAYVYAEDNNNTVLTVSNETSVNENQTTNESSHNISSVGEKNREWVKQRVEKIKEMRQKIQEQRQNLTQNLKQIKQERQDIWQNRMKVRAAVFSLFELRNLTGKFEKNFSKIAHDLNESEKNESQNEDKIVNRGKFVRFLMGGDRRSAKALLNMVNLTEKRIARLQALEANCTNCTAEVKQLIEDQIAVLKAQQQKYKDLANLELTHKGVFGWLFRD